MLHSQGMMTVRYIPNTGNNALFFVSAGRGVLHLLDSLAGKVSEAYDARVDDGHCVLTQPFRNASRIILSIYTSDQVRGHSCQLGCACLLQAGVYQAWPGSATCSREQQEQKHAELEPAGLAHPQCCCSHPRWHHAD